MTSGAAAFFDLDRTLLSGASGEVFSGAMRATGIMSRTIPGEKYMYNLFNAIGETLPSMALARQAVTLAKGRSQATMQAAAVSVAAQLVERVQPFAAGLFAQHRAAGRPIVLATTTPYDLVKPFADLLGLDDVVATRYGVNADGTYDGTLAGPFVWSAGKLAAVQEWADRHDVDMTTSYAYSDSVYDAPLLSAVGHPYAVNPDPRLMVLAAARRWPVLHLDVPAGVAKIPVVGLEVQRLALAFTRPMMFPYARFEITGTENIPATGPAILCGNHRSYFDPVSIALAIAKTGRTVRFLGKKEVFDAPIVGQIATAMGGIRVERGTGSDEPLKAAADALAAGDVVAIMPQGTIPRGIAFFEPVLQGRWGAAKLAALTGAPVIPIGLWGTERVWPRNAKLPNVLNLADPPLVTVTVGPPVDLKYKSADADTKRLMKAISALLPPEGRARRMPTDDELAATLPAGYTGDPRAEYTRRPGKD
jgi:putative phosphoserine phosphatase/1-acylglycerol-3-phosphate O-acyltransferase